MVIKKGRIPSLTHERHSTPDVEPETESASPKAAPKDKPLPDGPEGYKVYEAPQYVAVAPSGHKMYSLDGEEWFDGPTYFSR